MALAWQVLEPLLVDLVGLADGRQQDNEALLVGRFQVGGIQGMEATLVEFNDGLLVGCQPQLCKDIGQGLILPLPVGHSKHDGREVERPKGITLENHATVQEVLACGAVLLCGGHGPAPLELLRDEPLHHLLGQLREDGWKLENVPHLDDGGLRVQQPPHGAVPGVFGRLIGDECQRNSGGDVEPEHAEGNGEALAVRAARGFGKPNQLQQDLEETRQRHHAGRDDHNVHLREEERPGERPAALLAAPQDTPDALQHHPVDEQLQEQLDHEQDQAELGGWREGDDDEEDDARFHHDHQVEQQDRPDQEGRPPAWARPAEAADSTGPVPRPPAAQRQLLGVCLPLVRLPFSRDIHLPTEDLARPFRWL
mmetsp:Transcript_77185/g.240533  ORF Transcript_77185/g.240533 Transcript_77185/m.240533 type:complete len:367 (+) Transcript_77185:1105-2205(+)